MAFVAIWLLDNVIVLRVLQVNVHCFPIYCLDWKNFEDVALLWSDFMKERVRNVDLLVLFEDVSVGVSCSFK